MPISISDTHQRELRAKAHELGFDVCGITTAQLPDEVGERLKTFVALGHHGDMGWLSDSVERRQSPTNMWPEARSAIVLGMNYAPAGDPLTRLTQRSIGNISVYALNRDYHEIIKGKLKTLATWFARASTQEVKVFVDTAPLMEKPLAARAGLGWQGKHSNLVSRQLGSWFFLGVILSTAELTGDQAEDDHCGTCRACLDICPTQAFPAPYQLDARRCISYLTIEHKGPIPFEFRKAMGNRIYGCDDCLAVCPWNKFAHVAREAKLQARDDLVSPSLAHLLALDDAAFRVLFAGSPVKRIGRDRFIRNCLIAAGNSGDTELVPDVKAHLASPSPLLRGAAVWAVRQLQGNSVSAELMTNETDATVLAEWQA
jgi:epoxyqueuosine reductase